MIPYQPSRTPEFERYARTLKCPYGHRGTLFFIEGGGAEITVPRRRDRWLLNSPSRKSDDRAMPKILQRLRDMNQETFGALVIERFRTDSEFQCTACDESWPVFQHEQVDLLEGETRRQHTPLGSDERIVDHSGWSTQTQLELRFEKSWVRRLEIDWERATTRGTTISAGARRSFLGASFAVGAQRRVEESLKVRLALTSEARVSTTQTVKVTVPPGTVARIVTTWKQIWEETTCVVAFADGRTIEVPYRVATDVVFDAVMENLEHRT